VSAFARWTGVGVASVVVAHALAISAVSHCHYLFNPPTRQGWFYLELVLAASLWPALRWATPRVWEVAREAPLTRLGGPLALGLFVCCWWSGQVTDTLWLHGPAVRAVLGPVLAVADWITVSTVYAGLLTLTIAAVPPPPSLPAARDNGRADPRGGPGRVRPWLPLLAFALFLAAANAFTAWYIGRERTLYYWDYMVYWTRSADLAEALREQPPGEVWDQFRQGAQNDDYGPIPAALPAAVMAVFGDSRLVYILAVVNFYLSGYAIAAWLFVRRFAPAAGFAAGVAPLLVLLLSPLLWGPLLRGYLDVGGAALGVLALLVYLSRPAGRLTGPRVVLLAGLLVGMALFRRWYSFFVVAFFLVAGAETAAAALRGWLRGGWREAVRRMAPLVLTGAWAGVLLASLAAGWAYRAATTDYADTYAAYQMYATAAGRAWVAVEHCGLGAGAAAVAGLLAAICYRPARRPALVIAATTPLALALFVRVQGMGPHHYYLLLTAYVLLPALALASLPVWVRWPAMVVATAFGVATMIVGFHPDGGPVRERLGPAASPLVYPPMTRDDLPEMYRLIHYVGEQAERADGNVAVVASSLTINGTMFATADRTFREPLLRRDRVLIGGEVDRVNNFPTLFLQADVLVVADPPQIHLRPGEQQAVVITAESLLNRTDIGKAFDALPEEFRLRDGVMVMVYRRARAIPHEDFVAYCERLRAAHPTRPVFFTPPPGIEEYLRYPLPRGGR
jgi:hypothetical protein